MVVVQLRAHPRDRFIGVFDTSFLPKRGKRTGGLDEFFPSTTKRIQRQREVSGVISVERREVFALDATQTPPALATGEHTPAYSRIDFYLEQITDCLDRLPHVRYRVGDGHYAKQKVFDTLSCHGKDLIMKLRPDANLRLLARAWERRRPPAPLCRESAFR